MDGSTTDQRAQDGSCWSRTTEKAGAGSARRVHPPLQPPAKNVCNVVTSAPVDAPGVVVDVAGTVVVVGVETADVELVDEVTVCGATGRVDVGAVVGDADPQPARAHAAALDDMETTTTRAILTDREGTVRPLPGRGMP